MKTGAVLKQSRNKSVIGEMEDKIYLLTAPYVNLSRSLHLCNLYKDIWSTPKVLQFRILKSVDYLLSQTHWALQYLEKARAAIFEAKNMARIGPCWRQLVPFIGSYHWPKRQCQASDKGLRPPGCKQK